MSNDAYSCFESHEFFGEFFENKDSNVGRFAAKIKYSPENGLKLEYCISDSESPKSCDRLYGVLGNGKKCTLVGPFNLGFGTHYMGKVHVTSGVNGFSYLIIGEFIEPEQLFDNSIFTFNGMQEFIHPQGWIDHAEYQDEPIVYANGDDWKITVENTATYKGIGESLKKLVHSENIEAMRKLESFLDKIHEEHPDSGFSLRKNLKYQINYSTKRQQTAKKLLSGANKITSLFSILMSRPAFPDEIQLEMPGEVERLNVITSLSLELRTVELAKKEVSHNSMPINWKQVDMARVISRWFDVCDDYQVLSISHQYETGFRTLHYAHSDIILYSTQLEAINMDLGGSAAEKYENPINTYASAKLIIRLKNALKKSGENELGRAISLLRNELAHVGRPKVMMNKLNIDDYIEIGVLLRLVVISHLFSKLGVDRNMIHQYQNRLIH